MTVDLRQPRQLEKGNQYTAHSGHWKQENTFLAKLQRYIIILGGGTQKFEYHPFKNLQLLGGFYNQSDAEKCNWTCLEKVTPRILGEFANNSF